MGAVLLALAAVGLASPGAATAADPAEPALAVRDAYVSPRALGPATPAEEATLTRVAVRMAAEGRPVKLAIVLGPVGARSLPVYVRTLAGRLAYGGTLIVTTPGGAVAAAGPRTAADITRSLRAARVGAIANPTERLAAAASVAAPPAIDADQVSARTIVILVGIGVLGALWAVALGSGRNERRARREVAEARARTRVCLDALRARATALMRRDDLPPPARESVGRALGTYADAVTSLQETRGVAQVDAMAPGIRGGLDEIERAADTVGETMPGGDPFAGLCALDPAHGPSLAEAPLCAECDEAVGRGEPPLPRMLAEHGRPVPFDAVTYGPVLRPAEAADRA